MQISQVGMDNISEQNNKTRVSQIDGFASQGQNSINKENSQAPKDTIIFDKTRVSLRSLCETGEALNNIEDIINSGIEPDFLRAELAFRFNMNDTVGINIVLNYLAGNFKTALGLTDNLEAGNNQKFNEFMLYADYFGGNYDKSCAALQNMQELNFSPFLCYAYADMLLSLGFLDEARKFNLKYEVLAKKYLPDFVSEKEKYDEERKRRNQKLRREHQRSKKNKEKKQDNESVSGSPQLYESLKELLNRRKVLVKTLTMRNISIDKRPLLFELEDIDLKIAKYSVNKK